MKAAGKEASFSCPARSSAELFWLQKTTTWLKTTDPRKSSNATTLASNLPCARTSSSAPQPPGQL